MKTYGASVLIRPRLKSRCQHQPLIQSGSQKSAQAFQNISRNGHWMDRQASQPSRKPESIRHGRGKFDISFLFPCENSTEGFLEQSFGHSRHCISGGGMWERAMIPLCEQLMSNRVWCTHPWPRNKEDEFLFY